MPQSLDLTPWTDPNPSWTLMQWENAMRELLDTPPFQALMFGLPGQIYAHMGEVFVRQPEGPPDRVPLASQVTRRIFVRLMQDLRSVQLLSASGYAASAGTVASSVAEIAFEVAWVGNDETRAKQWLAHANSRAPVEKFGKRWTEVLAQRHMDPGERQAAEASEAEVYRTLCMLKHGNSLLQQGLGSFVEGGVMHLSPVPALSVSTLRTAAFAMFHTGRLCLDATADLIELSRPGTPEAVQTLRTENAALAQQLVRAHIDTCWPLELMDQKNVQQDKARLARAAMMHASNTVWRGRAPDR